MGLSEQSKKDLENGDHGCPKPYLPPHERALRFLERRFSSRLAAPPSCSPSQLHKQVWCSSRPYRVRTHDTTHATFVSRCLCGSWNTAREKRHLNLYQTQKSQKLRRKLGNFNRFIDPECNEVAMLRRKPLSVSHVSWKPLAPRTTYTRSGDIELGDARVIP